jgi:hypothetical protein
MEYDGLSILTFIALGLLRDTPTTPMGAVTVWSRSFREATLKPQRNRRRPMAGVEDMLRSAAPGGNIAKPLMLALGALLASGALFRGGGAGQTTSPEPQTTSDEGAGGVIGRGATRSCAKTRRNKREQDMRRQSLNALLPHLRPTSKRATLIQRQLRRA